MKHPASGQMIEITKRDSKKNPPIFLLPVSLCVAAVPHWLELAS